MSSRSKSSEIHYTVSFSIYAPYITLLAVIVLLCLAQLLDFCISILTYSFTVQIWQKVIVWQSTNKGRDAFKDFDATKTPVYKCISRAGLFK